MTKPKTQSAAPAGAKPPGAAAPFLQHDMLVKSGPVEVEVLEEPVPHKGKSDTVRLRLVKEGLECVYVAPNGSCSAFWTGRKGQRLVVLAAHDPQMQTMTLSTMSRGDSIPAPVRQDAAAAPQQPAAQPQPNGKVPAATQRPPGAAAAGVRPPSPPQQPKSDRVDMLSRLLVGTGRFGVMVGVAADEMLRQAEAFSTRHGQPWDGKKRNLMVQRMEACLTDGETLRSVFIQQGRENMADVAPSVLTQGMLDEVKVRAEAKKAAGQAPAQAPGQAPAQAPGQDSKAVVQAPVQQPQGPAETPVETPGETF
jgi:hypothetical protein